MKSSDRTSPKGPAAVLAHPLRLRILEVLNQRDMTPLEFCREGFAPAATDASQVADHFRELADHGAIAVVEEDPGRGSVERVYRGVGRVYFDDLQWNELDRAERARLSRAMVQGLMSRVVGALASETFDSRENRHLTWIAMRLDEQGWSEMTTALTATFGEVEQIRADAEKRLARDGEPGIASTCGLLGFPSPTGALGTSPEEGS